ncbi:prephenate dehydratase [Helicobacter fennelliae]|uniref:Bifunctional chorismate mutase/prephenate dehydratase n=1 Tax=Helicobacter fennelliae MRY12-0050 TaxID=1325130 RepID=T1DW60_9HELI|nr:prephenate dehydratase [Helicobacter fennelliae]GAD19152.1 chorismate mutase I [Helicobacter fennelliae MRY12-0050]STP08227.1 chorismate mutase\prephenate dehydratase [Helicobacter fennelliae]
MPKIDELDSLRAKIDHIDEQILELLNARLDIVVAIGATKLKTNGSIYRPEREKQIINRLSQLPSKHLNTQAIEAIYQEIFAISRNLELPEKVAYLGPIGSYTHQAAEERFGAMSEYLGINTISAIFNTLESKRAKYGVVPIENNTNGMVGECIDNLVQSHFKIVSEIILPIHHSFVSHCEHLHQIKRIYSKDIAFGQCDTFLMAHNLLSIEQIPTESTAKAAQLAAKDKESAAICSKIAAKLYHIPVMFDNIQNSNHNKTRFIVVSDFTNAPSGNDRTSIFATPNGFNEAGTLLGLLQDFKDANINLTKIDSRPIRSKSDFSYGFYIDFDGHIKDEAIAQIFAKRANQLKWLGSYPKTDV